MGRIRRMNCQQVERVLTRHGFVSASQRGSHRKWRHPQRHLQVVVADHGGRDLPLGTLRIIFVNAEIPESDWQDG